jgi:hypothetical protein
MSKIINPKEEEAIKTAAGQPHGFVYLDKILQVKTDGYNVQITIGWENPNGTYSPVVTAAMPVPFAKELADALARVANNADEKRDGRSG